jgi:surfactin synthase thioesterase subunit
MTSGRAAAATVSRWFREPPGRVDTAACLLFCLPYSGGGASAFRSWTGLMAPQVGVLPVCLPGREERIGEPPCMPVSEVAAAIAARADRPYAIYGHSMGARLGFEVIRELGRCGAPLPVAFYPAAARPLDIRDPLADIVLLPDDEFLATLTDRVGMPAEVAQVPELRSLLLPVLRADFGWIHQYRYQPDPPLPVPVVALAGLADNEVTADVMLGWQRLTSAGFRLHTIDGGHLFLQDAAAPQLCDLLSGDLLAAAGRVAGNAAPPVPAPAGDEVHLWAALTDDLPGPALWAGLAPDEVLRAARLKDDTARRQYVAGRALRAWVLRRYGGVGGLTVAVSEPGPVTLAGVAGAPGLTVQAGGPAQPASPEAYRLRFGDVPVTVAAPGLRRLRFEVVTQAGWLADGS